jgi:hypothetical protein
MKKYKIAVLDDYQNAALESADRRRASFDQRIEEQANRRRGD